MDSLVEKLNKRFVFQIKKDCSTQTDSFLYYYPALLRYDEEIDKENPFFDGGELGSKADFILRHMKISGGKIQIFDPDTEEHANCQWKDCISDNKREENYRIMRDQTDYLREFESIINENSIDKNVVSPLYLQDSVYHLSEDNNNRCQLSTSMCKTNHSSYAYIYDTCDRQLSNTSLTDLLVSYVASKPKNPFQNTSLDQAKHIKSCENAQLITRVSSPRLNYDFPSDQFQSLNKFEILKPKTLTTDTKGKNESLSKTSRYFNDKTNEFQKIVDREISNTISSPFYKAASPANYKKNGKNNQNNRIVNTQSITNSQNTYNPRLNTSSSSEGYIEVFSRGKRFEREQEFQSGRFKCETNVDETVISVTVPATFASSDKSYNLEKKSYKPIEPLLFNIASFGLNTILKSQSEQFLSKKQKLKKKS